MTGHFNKANPKKEIPTFIQQVTCVTRDCRKLDHCYTTIKGAYRSIPRAPLGSRQLGSHICLPFADLQTTFEACKPTVKTVKQCSVNAVQTLRCCFECTDSGVFKEAVTDIHEYTDTVTNFMNDDKIQYLPIVPKSADALVDKSVIRVGTATITASLSVQCLGVCIDRHLDMKKQVLQTTSACSFYLRNINQISRFLPRPKKERVVNATTVTHSYTARLQLTSPVYSEHITRLPG